MIDRSSNDRTAVDYFSDSRSGQQWCLREQFWPTCAFLGVSMASAISYAYVTPLLTSFELDLNEVGVIWFLASFGSCITVPLVGASSDYAQHPLGRRRPFMAWFLLVAVGGLLLLAYAEKIGFALGDSIDEQWNALAMALVGLFLAQIGLDGIQCMERGIVTDTLEASTLEGANSFFALNGNLGRLLGYGLGAVNLGKLPGLSYLGDQTQILFSLSAMVLVLFTFITLVTAAEKPFFPQLHDLFNAGLFSSGQRALFGAKSLPKAVRRAFISNLLNWSGWAFLFYYGSDFMGSYIFGGDAEDTGAAESAYERGIQAASFGYLLQAVVGSVSALLLIAPLSKAIGLKKVWVLSLTFSAGIFLGLFFLRPGDKIAAQALFASLGFSLACSYQLPWVSRCVEYL